MGLESSQSVPPAELASQSERAVGSLLADESERMRIAAAAEAYALREAHVLDAIAAAATPWLPPHR